MCINKSLKSTYMKTIDGVRYISAKEYAEIMNLTVGRVSQLKSELPFVKFEEFGIEVINFDLLSLSQSEKTLAQAKFETGTPIHSLSFKDLGNYFAKFAMDSISFKGSADIVISDLQAKVVDFRQKFEISEQEKSEVTSQFSKQESEIKALKNSLEDEQKINENLSAELGKLKTTNEEMNFEFDALSKEHQDLKIVHNEGKHELEIKIIENKNLSAENENLKARLASMELSAKSDTDFREEFKTFKELVMKKIK